MNWLCFEYEPELININAEYTTLTLKIAAANYEPR